MKRNSVLGVLCALSVISGAYAADEAKTPAAPAAPAAQPAAADVWSVIPEKVASVNGKAVTRDDFRQFVLSLFPNKELPPQMNADAMKMMAYRLTEMSVLQPLMLQSAEKAGFKPSAAAVEAQMNEAVKQMSDAERKLTEEQVQAQTKMSLADFIKSTAAQKQAQDKVAISEFVNKDLLAKVTVSEEEVRKYYNENATRFQIPEMIEASHILIAYPKNATPEQKAEALKKAEEIAKKIKLDPSLFPALAKAESACPSKDNGGSLGKFKKGDMNKPFEEAAFALKKGEISGVVETPEGYHIIRCDEIFPATTLPFEQVKPMLNEFLLNQAKNKVMEEFISKLKKDNKVEIFVKQPEMPALPMMQ